MVRVRLLSIMTFSLLTSMVNADNVDLNVTYDMFSACMAAGFGFPLQEEFDFESLAVQRKLEGFENEIIL